MARHFNYYDDWETAVLTCPVCGWKGTFDEGSVESHEVLMDSSCPRCSWPDAPMLAIVNYPTMDESLANWDKLPREEQEAMERVYKIGQESPVFACRLISRDTVEEKMMELQKRKAGLLDPVIDAQNSDISKLVVEDLEHLLS